MQTELVKRLLALEKPVILVTFGNPYAASTFQESEGVVVAYDQSLQTIVAAVRVLQGAQRAPGRLPITVEPFAYGSGMDWVAGTNAAPDTN
jgi:beta-N-acetylhexosaminidase